MLQYGEKAVHEWTLEDYQTVEEVVEAAKNITRQEGRETRTAFAIHKAWYGEWQEGLLMGAGCVDPLGGFGDSQHTVIFNCGLCTS